MYSIQQSLIDRADDVADIALNIRDLAASGAIPLMSMIRATGQLYDVQTRLDALFARLARQEEIPVP